MSKINLWSDGFKTENYKVLNFSLYNELELSILTEYFKDFLIEEIRTVGEQEIRYSVVDTVKVAQVYSTQDFIDKIESAESITSKMLGDEVAMSTSFYSYFFLIPSLYYEILAYKKTLKKK